MVLRIRGGRKIVDINQKPKSQRNYLSLTVPPPRKDTGLVDEENRMSVSRLQTFVKCPFYFKLQYVDGFKVADPSEYLSKGKELHDMYYFSSMTGMPEVIRSFDGYNKYPDDCENFINMAKSIQLKTGQNVPLFAEKEIYDSDDKVLLYIDRIDRVGVKEDVVEVLDYKTGQPKPLNEYRFQLAFYVYYVEKLLKLKVKRWGVMFTGGSGKLDYELVDRQKVNMVPEMLRLVRDEIANCHTVGFNKRRNSFCYNCKFKLFALCDGAHHMQREKYTYGLLDVYRHEWNGNGGENGKEE